MKEKLFLLWQEKRLRILLVLGVVFCVLVVSIFATSPRSSVPNRKHTPQISQTPSTSSVYFETYQNNASLPLFPPVISVYTLKNSFTPDEAIMFAVRLGMHNITRPSDNTSFSYTVLDPSTKSLLSFDRNIGAVSFQSSGDLKPISYHSAEPAPDEAIAILEQIGLADPTVDCPITYQRKSTPGVTFVECHRDWKKVGLPIFNFDGLLNIPEQTPLSSLAEGSVNTINFPDDPDITGLSGITAQSMAGKARPAEFNTATVSIDTNGHIISIKSNLRWIAKAETMQSQGNLLTPQQALQQFLSHNAYLSLTQPLGSGQADPGLVYQNNRTYAKNATITDYVLSYIEKTPDQTQQYLVPMYTIRGSALLESGYRVSFVQTVPALKDQRTFLSQKTHLERETIFSSLQRLYNLIISIPFTHPVYAYNNQTLQLKTFYPSTTGTSQSPTTQPSGSPGLTQCFDYNNLDFTVTTTFRFKRGLLNLDQTTLTDTGSGTINTAYNLVVAAGAAGGYSAPDMFFYESSSFPLANTNAVKDAFFSVVVNQYTINVARHLATDQSGALNSSSTINDVKNLFSRINGGTCSVTSGPTANAAPNYNCPNPTGTLDTARVNSVADAAATQILNAVQKNTISSLAGQQDLFPASALPSRITFEVVNPLRGLSANNASLLQPCYITGGISLIEGASPSLFMTAPAKTTAVITLPSFLTYADPGTNTNIWKVTVNPEGLLEDMHGITYQHLYYEYNKNNVLFSAPKEGFVTSYPMWQHTASDIATQLQLTKSETDQLVLEIQNALYGKPKTPYLILSLIPQQELQARLPLTISPQPNTLYRIHVLITPVMHMVSMPHQIITPLSRNGFTVVEVGAREM